VGHVKQWVLDDSGRYIQNQAHFPLGQDPDQWIADNYGYLKVMVRTPLDTATVMPAIKAAVYGAGNEQPVYKVQTMQEFVSQSMSSQRFPMILLAMIAGFALLLASIGIDGVISYSVTQWMQEIGIRMALGAARSRVFRAVTAQGLQLARIGSAFGAVAALILAKLLSTLALVSRAAADHALSCPSPREFRPPRDFLSIRC